MKSIPQIPGGAFEPDGHSPVRASLQSGYAATTRGRAGWGAALLAALGLILTAGVVRAQDPAAARQQLVRQQLFERVFGDAVKLDPAIVEKVKASKPGERLFLNPNSEGKPQECWFIDDHVRHRERNRPILVRAIDPNGIDEVRGPNLSSTLYVVDWHANGTVDVVLDYQDKDGDGDVDEMAFYFYMARHAFFGQDVLRVWWGRDDGDDNLLWADIDYTYDQDAIQYRCHFGGDETFVAFGMLPDSTEWLSAWENPFLFYDPDGDNSSEVVLRIEGHDDEVRSIRYSFDADDDAYGRRSHDYDFSITAYTPDDKPLKLPPDSLEKTTLRGFPTQPWLRRDKATQLVAESDAWMRSLLTWDEMNANTEHNLKRDPHERWEGILNQASLPEMKQVGGPPTSALNKRNELALNPVSPMALYYDPSDHRIHLVGANKGWLKVDFNFDGKVDAEYAWIDTNNDGRFDRRTIDLNADGTVDFDWPMQTGKLQEIPLEWKTIKDFYLPMMQRVLADSQSFVDAAKAALGNPAPDEVEAFYRKELASWTPETGLGAYMRKSPAGQMYYLGLVRDRLLLALKQRFGTQSTWGQIEQAYASGDYKTAGTMVTRLSRVQPASGRAYGHYTRRLPIRIENRGARRLDWPTTIAVNDIRKVAPDFNPDNFAVVGPERWLDWREIPSQLDSIEPAVGREISFLVDLPDHEGATYYLYWAPGQPPVAPGAQRYPVRTMTAGDWLPPNIGWENTRTGFRMYWGQFDFFGKKTDTLIYPGIRERRENYHRETDWGIDALHAGETCGIGGLWLYEGDRAVRLYNPAGKGQIKFTTREVVSGPVRAAIEVTGTNIDPARPDLAVRMLAIVYAERMESEIRVHVSGASRDAQLAPGLTKLPREKVFADARSGSLGSWGYQDRLIDEIGMAVMVAPGRVASFVDEPEEHRVRCRTVDGRLQYWIMGDWRRGRQFPTAPTIENWRAEVTQLAGELNQRTAVTLGRSEDAR